MMSSRYRALLRGVWRHRPNLKAWCHLLRDATVVPPLTGHTPVPPTLDTPHWGFGQIWVDDHGHVHVYISESRYQAFR